MIFGSPSLIWQMKMKPIPPTMREKQRYVVFDIKKTKSSDSFQKRHIEEQIRTSLKNLVGDLGLAKANLNFVDKNIIRVCHDMVDYLKAALSLTTTINGTTVQIKTLGVSGILNKARKRYQSASEV